MIKKTTRDTIMQKQVIQLSFVPLWSYREMALNSKFFFIPAKKFHWFTLYPVKVIIGWRLHVQLHRFFLKNAIVEIILKLLSQSYFIFPELKWANCFSFVFMATNFWIPTLKIFWNSKFLKWALAYFQVQRRNLTKCLHGIVEISLSRYIRHTYVYYVL